MVWIVPKGEEGGGKEEGGYTSRKQEFWWVRWPGKQQHCALLSGRWVQIAGKVEVYDIQSWLITTWSENPLSTHLVHKIKSILFCEVFHFTNLVGLSDLRKLILEKMDATILCKCIYFENMGLQGLCNRKIDCSQNCWLSANHEIK